MYIKDTKSVFIFYYFLIFRCRCWRFQHRARFI